jgi:iron complex outermembrane receptor protein
VADFDKSLSVSNTSPKLSVRYEASKTTNFYSNLSRGFKSGGYNVRANNLVVPDSARPYKDEKLDALEVGMKYAAPDDTFDANVALFYNRYKDIQLSVFTSYVQPGGLPGFYGDFTNAGKGTVKGAEFEFSWRPNRQWEVNGFLALLNASYDEFMSGGKNIADTQKFSKHAAAPGGPEPDAHGPRRVWRRPAQHGRLRLPQQGVSDDGLERDPGAGRLQYGRPASWEAPKNWTFSLHGSNLGNKRYRTDGYNIPALYILDGFYGPPRQIIAKAGYKF